MTEETAGARAGETRPYAHDKLSALCKRKAYDFDRALARLTDLMKAFDGNPGVTDYDAWIDQIDQEMRADPADDFARRFGED